MTRFLACFLAGLATAATLRAAFGLLARITG